MSTSLSSLLNVDIFQKYSNTNMASDVKKPWVSNFFTVFLSQKFWLVPISTSLTPSFAEFRQAQIGWKWVRCRFFSFLSNARSRSTAYQPLILTRFHLRLSAYTSVHGTYSTSDGAVQGYLCTFSHLLSVLFWKNLAVVAYCLLNMERGAQQYAANHLKCSLK